MEFSFSKIFLLLSTGTSWWTSALYDDLGIADLKFLLLCFETMSELKINFNKSEVVVTGVDKVEQQQIANLLTCNISYL